MLTIVFALLAGIATITTPCTLPVLPILLGASVGQTSGLRPLFITLGFVGSFAAVVLVFSAVTQVLGIDQNTLRMLAVVFLIGLGVLMLRPQLGQRSLLLLAEFGGNFASRLTNPRTGNWGGLVVGTTLGLVWTPCAGPILASILAVVATSHELSWGAILLLSYSIGAGLPMLGIAFGGQFVTTRVRLVARVSRHLERVFGIIVICFAIAMYFQFDLTLTAWLSDLYPTAHLSF